MLNQKGNMILVGVLIGSLAMVGLFGAYYLGTKQAKVSNQKEDNETITKTSTPIPSPSVSSSIPSNWILKKSALCDVSMPLPPKEAPYITAKSNLAENMDSGAFWQFEEIDRSSDDLFKRGANIFYRDPEALGSGYAAGSVWVTCSPNTGYTTDTLMTAYEKKFTDGEYQGFEIQSKQLINKWGQNVWEVRHIGGMYNGNNPSFYFATPSYIYSVNRMSMSENQFVKDTTEKIFENLVF